MTLIPLIPVADYQEIELLFPRLLQEVAVSFSAEEAKEVSDFIDVGEYGLALQTLVDVVVVERRRISTAAFMIVEKLASMMEISEEIDWAVVRQAVD